MRRELIVIGFLSLIAGAAQAGGVEGRVALSIEGVRLGELGPTVAFLSGRAGAKAPREFAVLRQRDASFDPEFLVVSAGQEVSMPNMDTIFHNVFSFSRPNDFDLGLYPKGQTRSVRMSRPGVVHIYCSIHDSMSGVILVTPGPHHARVDAAGRYAISGVPAGVYELTIWNERLPKTVREVRVGETSNTRVDVSIGVAAP